MNLDQVFDFERIRDYGMLVVYSNWSYLKNESSVNRSIKTGTWTGWRISRGNEIAPTIRG
jgi:hypothetical protein